MARQPIANLQGYCETSQSAARPIDAYTGAPAIPQETPGSQLANALGVMGNAVGRAGARNAAKAKAEQEKITAKKMNAYGQEIVAQGKEFGGQDELAAEFPSASTLQKITLAETIGKNRYRAKATERLGEWLNNESNLLTDGGYDALKADLFKEFSTETAGQEFVAAGMTAALNEVFANNLTNYTSAADAKVKDVWNTEHQASIFHIADNATSVEQIAGLIQLEDEKTHPYKKDPAKMREITVGHLIAYDLQSDKAPITEQVMALKPWMRSNESVAQLKNAKPKIVAAKMQKLRAKVFFKDQEDKRVLDDAQAKLNELAENNDIAGIQAVQGKAAGVTGKDAAVSNAIYKAAEIAEASAKVAPDVSASNYTSYNANLTLRATKGGAGTLEEELAAIQSRTDITPTDKATLLREAPTLMQGHKIIASEEHTSAFTNRFRSILAAYETNPQLMVKSFALAKQGLSAESISRDTWDNETSRLIQLHIENNDTVPNFNDLYGDEGIYAKAEVKVTERLQAIASVTAQNPQVPEPQEETEQEELPVVTSQEEFDALPSGAQFLENGKLFTKP